MDRKKFHKQKQNSQQQNESFPSTSNDSNSGMSGALSECSFSFKLKRSGRIIRKIEGAPPIHLRNWKPLNDELNLAEAQQKYNQIFKNAERLYIAKPLLHLGAVGLFGYKSWKGYLISLTMDILR